VAYRVEINAKAAKEIRALPRGDQKRIISKAQALADNPRPPGCVKLSRTSDLRHAHRAKKTTRTPRHKVTE